MRQRSLRGETEMGMSPSRAGLIRRSAAQLIEHERECRVSAGARNSGLLALRIRANFDCRETHDNVRQPDSNAVEAACVHVHGELDGRIPDVPHADDERTGGKWSVSRNTPCSSLNRSRLSDGAATTLYGKGTPPSRTTTTPVMLPVESARAGAWARAEAATRSAAAGPPIVRAMARVRGGDGAA